MPFIVGPGGINAAGRSSAFHRNQRMVPESLPENIMADTWRDLAHRMGLSDGGDPDARYIAAIRDGTLARRIETCEPVRQSTVCAGLDMLRSLGMESDAVMRRVASDEVAMYAGSSFSSMDDCTLGGLIGHLLRGGRAGAEAPLTLAFINDFAAMGALADDHALRRFAGGDAPGHRRARRPFSTNAGFTLGESARLPVLMRQRYWSPGSTCPCRICPSAST